MQMNQCIRKLKRLKILICMNLKRGCEGMTSYTQNHINGYSSAIKCPCERTITQHFFIKFDGNIFLNRFFMKTRSYNFDHLIPNFYIVKLGFGQGNTPVSSFFLFLAKNRLWVYPQIIFEPRKTTTKRSQFSR